MLNPIAPVPGTIVGRSRAFHLHIHPMDFPTADSLGKIRGSSSCMDIERLPLHVSTSGEKVPGIMWLSTLLQLPAAELNLENKHSRQRGQCPLYAVVFSSLSNLSVQI